MGSILLEALGEGLAFAAVGGGIYLAIAFFLAYREWSRDSQLLLFGRRNLRTFICTWK